MGCGLGRESPPLLRVFSRAEPLNLRSNIVGPHVDPPAPRSELSCLHSRYSDNRELIMPIIRIKEGSLIFELEDGPFKTAVAIPNYDPTGKAFEIQVPKKNAFWVLAVKNRMEGGFWIEERIS